MTNQDDLLGGGQGRSADDVKINAVGFAVCWLLGALVIVLAIIIRG